MLSVKGSLGILLCVIASGQLSWGDDETTTLTPLPFKYAFAASRVPGGSPDRYVEQEGDGEGVIRGSYTYLDPNHQWRKVSYSADKDGFHVEEDSNTVPKDTVAVANAKAKHDFLFQEMALRNSKVPVPIISVSNVESAAVMAKRLEFEQQYAAIAAEHARIAEEHAKLAEQEEKEEKEEKEKREYEQYEEARRAQQQQQQQQQRRVYTDSQQYINVY